MGLYRTIRADLAAGRIPSAFPDVAEPDAYGLVFVGGVLSVPSLIEAYTRGFFPWTGEHPIPWFSPDPRLVLFPEHFRTTRRFRRTIRQGRFTIRFDTDFHGVIRACAAIPRKGQRGTWITDNMTAAYTQLHQLGIAHSVETYDGSGRLCGGLYGLTFGRAFFGESMFTRRSGGSKLALWGLCRFLEKEGFHFIDCQQVTPHLMRMGAVPIRRSEYLNRLAHALAVDSLHRSWADIASAGRHSCRFR